MTILYKVHRGLYVNLTNKCPCACTFCLRQEKNSQSLYGDLWLSKEPTVDEVIEEFRKHNLNDYNEIVFCGFGEPTVRLYDIFEIAKYLRTVTDLPIRINTNGMADLIWGKSTAQDFEGLIDVVSISLNTPNRERYYEITKNKFGIKSFDGILEFAKNVKKYVKEVVLSTVETTISKAEEEECRQICEELGVTYRIRPFEDYSKN